MQPQAPDTRDDGGDDVDRAQSLTRIVLRPFGSPLPIGFFAFGAGALLTALLELGVVPSREARMVAMAGLVFCVPLELIAAVIAFGVRDGAGGTILGLFAATWAVSATQLLLMPPPATSVAAGIFFGFVMLVAILIALAALKSKPFFGVLLIVSAARFGLIGAFHLFDAGVLRTLAGIVGLVLSAVALYGGEALLIEDTQQRTVLPLMRRYRARTAIEGSLRDQIDRVVREAGVRHQL